MQTDSNLREAIPALAMAARQRLRWRHVICVWLAAFAILLCLGGAWLELFGRPRDRLAGDRDLLAAALGGGYLVACVVASWGLAAGDRQKAARRLPLVILLSLVVLALALAFGQLPAADTTGGGGRSGGGPSGQSASGARGSRRRIASDLEASNINLARAAVDSAQASRLLGGPLDRPRVLSRRLVRNGGRCVWRTPGGGRLHAWVCEASSVPRRARPGASAGALPRSVVRANRRVTMVALQDERWFVQLRLVAPAQADSAVSALEQIARGALKRLRESASAPRGK